MISKKEMKEILEDYAPDDDIFSEEDENLNKLKHIIYELDEVDKRCMLMYAELGSLRKLGNELGVSVASAFQKIKDIKKKIYDKLNTNNTSNRIRN